VKLNAPQKVCKQIRRYFVNLPIDQLLMGRATNLNKLKLFTAGGAFLHYTKAHLHAEMVSTPPSSSLIKIGLFLAFLDETKEQTSQLPRLSRPTRLVTPDFKGT
jgi:hypothetical protein